MVDVADHIESGSVGGAAVVNEEARVEVHHHNASLRSTIKGQSEHDV